jgi:hypothetical protein
MNTVARKEKNSRSVLSVLFTVTIFIAAFEPVTVYSSADGSVGDVAPADSMCGIGGKGLLGIDWEVLNALPNLGCVVTLALYVANNLLGFAVIPLIIACIYASFILAANGWFGEVAGLVNKEGNSDAIARAKNIFKGSITLLIMIILLSLIVTMILRLFGANVALFGL